jgi:hypothetical protein
MADRTKNRGKKGEEEKGIGGALGVCLRGAGLKKAKAAARRAEATPEEKAVREAAAALEQYVGKVIEVHYLSTGRPTVTREELMQANGEESFLLGSSMHHHMVFWDHSDAVNTRRSAVKRIMDCDGKLLFERADIPFDMAAAKRLH